MKKNDKTQSGRVVRTQAQEGNVDEKNINRCISEGNMDNMYQNP